MRAFGAFSRSMCVNVTDDEAHTLVRACPHVTARQANNVPQRACLRAR